jgi:hypothetical protein
MQARVRVSRVRSPKNRDLIPDSGFGRLVAVRRGTRYSGELPPHDLRCNATGYKSYWAPLYRFIEAASLGVSAGPPQFPVGRLRF